MSSTEVLVANYGLLAVFLGGLLEGETVLILAAVAAHHGTLSLPAVFLFAWSAATIGDQGWFLLARHGSEAKYIKRAVSSPVVQQALKRVQEHPTIFVLSFRFVYGLRIGGAIACGLSDIPTSKFVALNIVAALVWTGVFLGIGYGFGGLIETVLGDVKRLEWKLIVATAAFAALILAFRMIRQARSR